MKFYSEKLSPRRLSLQWRLTLLISGLVITACALMYFFISRSAVTGLEGISDYVVLVTPDNSNPISINVDPKILIPDLENQIQNTKNNFFVPEHDCHRYHYSSQQYLYLVCHQKSPDPPAQIQRQDPPGTGTESV
mgnify:FL=1